MIDILFLMFWWVFFLFISFIPVPYRTGWYVFSSLFLVGIGGVTAWQYYREAYPKAIMKTDSMVRVGPDETYGICGAVQAKDNVVICKTCGDWKHIQKIAGDDWFNITGGIRGWVHRDCVVSESNLRSS